MSGRQNWLRSWKLVSWRSAVVAAVVVYGLAGFFVVPSIAKKLIVDIASERTGREVTVEKVRCNPFTLSLTIEGFSIPDRPGSVLLSFDRLYGNAQVSSLFRWAATLKELRIENPFVALRRFEDGAVNVLEVINDLPESAPEPDDKGGLPRALLQHVQVVDARVELEDRYNRPETLLWQLGPNQVELLDLSTIPDREGTNDVVVLLPGGGRATVAGKIVVEPLGLRGTLTVENNRAGGNWEAVAHLFEFALTNGVVDLEFDYQIGLEEDGLHLVLDDANVRVTDLGFKSDFHEEELLKVDDIHVTGGRLKWPEQDIAAESIVIVGASAFGWIEPDGRPNWEVLVPEPTRDQIVETYQTLEEKIHATARLGRFELRDAGAEFEDETASPPVRFEVHDVNLVVTDITTEEGSTWPLKAAITLEGEALASASGYVGVSPIDAEVDVMLEGLDLSKYRGYVAQFAPLDLRAGVLSVAGVVKAARPKVAETFSASYEGGFEVAGLNLNETVTNGKLLGWGDLSVAGVTAELEPLGAEVTDVDIFTAGLEITVAEDGTINLLEFFKAISEGHKGSAASTEATTESDGLPPLRIARFRLHDCYGLYTDNTVLGEPFTLEIRPVDGTISGISTTSTSPATLDIDAGIATGGAVRVGGDLDIFDYTRLTDLSIDLRDVVLAAMSPMSVKFIGHPLSNGGADLDLDYEIADRYLTASNHIEADDLELGDKVEGQGLVKLPFKLGVSLLKDKEGRIVLEIPFEGSFDTPGFGMATAAGAAAKEVFTQIVASPFKLLGKLGGGGDRDLEHVEFAAGSAVLDDRSAEKIAVLVAGLEERPTLSLGIVGVFDAEADAAALRIRALESALIAEGVTREELESTVPLASLEKLYRAAIQDPSLDSLRTGHTVAVEGDPTGTLDEIAYRRALRRALIEEQVVDPAEVTALASARADAVLTACVDTHGMNPARVRILDTEPADPPGEDWVRCRLELAPE
ncbi:MAG: DUF748 domain-containing protein [Thermoanaerobaculales bacterium]|nr:DUF748 domain-containing protein [Thermoanaerobaculales bacterium]